MMVWKLLRCADVVADEPCSVLFVGANEEIVEAFKVHAVSRHSARDDSALVDAARRSVVNVVIDGEKRAYVGDQFELVDGTNTVNVTGPAVVMRESEATVSVDCKCQVSSGGGTACKITISGQTVTCTEDTCFSCGITTTVPSLDGVDRILGLAFE